MRVSFLGRNDGKYPAFQSHPVFSRTKRKRNLHLLLDITSLSRPRKSAEKANTERGKNGIIHAMKPHAMSALSLALAIVGGMAADMRYDASVWVENSSQTNPRGAAYTVKTYTAGSDPFDAEKGFIGGTCNTLLDACPYVGWGKLGIECITGDWFPDNSK